MEVKDIRRVPADRLGVLGRNPSGNTYVKFVRDLPCSPAALWQAITDQDSLADWFPGFQLEPVEGGTFNIWFGGECDGPAHLSGTIDVYDKPEELRCGGMRWRIESVAGASRLTFTDVIRFGQDHRDPFEIINSVLAGWHFYVDRLEDVLAGTLDPGDTLEFDYSGIEIAGRPEPT